MSICMFLYIYINMYTCIYRYIDIYIPFPLERVRVLCRKHTHCNTLQHAATHCNTLQSAHSFSQTHTLFAATWAPVLKCVIKIFSSWAALHMPYFWHVSTASCDICTHNFHTHHIFKHTQKFSHAQNFTHTTFHTHPDTRRRTHKQTNKTRTRSHMYTHTLHTHTIFQKYKFRNTQFFTHTQTHIDAHKKKHTRLAHDHTHSHTQVHTRTPHTHTHTPHTHTHTPTRSISYAFGMSLSLIIPSIPTKEPYDFWLFCGKRPTHLRHSMYLHHFA